MPKDGVSLVTAPANAIYTYQVRAKGIDIVQSPDEDEVCRPCAVGYSVWMKPPGSRYTIRFKCGRVTGVISQQSVLFDGIPDHLCDLHPALETGHSVTNERDGSSDDELLMDCASGLLENVNISSLDNSEAETVVHIPLRPKGHPCSALCVIKRSGESIVTIMLTRDEKG